MAKKSLDDLFAEDDDLGLLNVKPLAKPTSETSRMQQQFEEINGFIDRHGFAPGAGLAGRKPSVNETVAPDSSEDLPGKPPISERICWRWIGTAC